MRRAIPTLVIIAGLGLIYPLQRWIETTTPREAIAEESLYFASGETIKRMSLGLDAIVADVYWIRTVQYFGRKLLDSGQPLSSASTQNIRMDLLAPLLKIIVTLDPHHIPAYRFGAIFLPERDFSAAVELLERGVRDNPAEWRLYQDLGYMYWQAGDYEKAAEWYDQGGRIPGAMWWMRDLAGLMKIRGGSRETARAIYSRYLESDDENIRAQAATRLNQLRSLDERDALNSLLDRYRQQTGACPNSLRALAGVLRSLGFNLNEESIPLDPGGAPYVLNTHECRAELSPDSKIPL